jgi:hypothetical protein
LQNTHGLLLPGRLSARGLLLLPIKKPPWFQN